MTNTNINKNWLIYGAYGYTGKLIAEEAVSKGLTPILAGRNHQKTEQLANQLGLDFIAFDLDNPQETHRSLNGISLALNCAGPFSVTAKSMMEACLQSGAHYLDITGEISVFELAQSYSTHAQKSNVVICPGVGFDVIPTDCIAASLKESLPDATHLALGFDTQSPFSPGTAKTTVEGLAMGGKVRINKHITTVPLAYKVKQIDFGNGEQSAMTIPWGDVSTAYHTTQIPNVEVYIPASPAMIKNAKRANYIRPILKFSWVQSLLKKYISKTVQGPDSEQRESTDTYIWGQATNASGVTKTGRVKTANIYSITVSGALAVTEHLLLNDGLSGIYTPAKLMGSQFVSELAGSEKIQITP